ncbi:MAG: hypothetical protein AABX32_02210 [Nanoarchaeota archaeon]
MQIEKFEKVVQKGNNNGAGFIKIPKEIIQNYKIDYQVKIKINSNIEIYVKIRKYYGTIGFYIPAKIMAQYNLINCLVKVEVEKMGGFYTSIGEDGIIYLPNQMASKLNLKNNDIIEIRAIIDGIKEIKYPMVSVKSREKTTEYYCLFNHEKCGQAGSFEIVRKLNSINYPKGFSKSFYSGLIDDAQSILYSGNHKPIIVNNNINLKEIVHYLGCYFSDGTKKGFNWGICASTFEQANYYYKMHNQLIAKNRIAPYISFTDTENRDKDKLSENLISVWKDNVKYLPNNINVRIINSVCKPSLKTGKFGTLVMRESRQLIQQYYNQLLKLFFDEIKLKQNKELAIDFICGVLEGDGSVSPHLGHLIIATNNRELILLSNALECACITYNVRVEGENKSCIHIGLLEVIRNIGILKDKIFIYYPKRRKLLKERLANTASVRFLLGKTPKTSNWLIGQFNKMGILDGKGNLTEFGAKIQKDLKGFLSEQENENKKVKIN